ncbi:amidohydrolase family protein [Sphingobacterium sp. Mn56C]|uniref:amidohydrolase family protein n=1 Tax=Sphingobacterium sp. Mn56C TaxID=3395261 RepID=UPI003BC34CD2
MRIDAHQHFWLYEPVKDAWITDDMQVIQRNFLPNDISGTLKKNHIDGAVVVQADQSVQETSFLVEMAEAYKMVKAVVGWVDLRAENINEQLAEFAKHPIIKGFRHIIEAETDADFLIRPDFQRGLEALTQYNYTFDLLVKPIHYASTLACVAANPNQQFMLDHMAKPNIKTQDFNDWASFIRELARYPNVYCKVSGLVTEADWENWSVADFKPYIDHAVSAFGLDRVCYGSDWPVSLLAASYEDVLHVVAHSLQNYSPIALEGFWGNNAVRFYQIK